MSAASEEIKIRRKYTEEQLEAVIAAAVQEHGAHRDAIIPILSQINQTIGYIPTEALGKIRRLINAPQDGLFLADSHLYAIASFYHMFSLQPTGKHIVRYCASAPCHVVGGRQMVQALQKYLELQPGETSPDQQWSLIETSCMGICAVGPAFMVDDDIFGNITPERIPGILSKYGYNV